jgi:[acyl-carrier-protein] S-malonyltransferase
MVLEPLLVAVGCACTELLGTAGFEPGAVAGYSAGEVSALYAAGSLDSNTCLRVACLRGAALEKAAKTRPGTMISLQGMLLEELRDLIEDGTEPVSVSGFHGPRNFTVAASPSVLASLSVRARRHGARIDPIEVAGAWHSPWLKTVQKELSRALAKLPFHAAKIPVWLGSRGEASRDPEVFRVSLAESVAVPVRWLEVVNDILAKGFFDFLDIGPGRTLWGLLGQLLPAHGTRSFLERPGGPLLGPLAQYNKISKQP